MRSLFILLLLINLSYLIWGVAFSEKNNISATVQQPLGKQTLTLLSEQPNDLVANSNKQSLSKISKVPKAKVVVKADKDVNVFGVNECVICDTNRKLPKVYRHKKATNLIY